jgi:hypothetical protein
MLQRRNLAKVRYRGSDTLSSVLKIGGDYDRGRIDFVSVEGALWKTTDRGVRKESGRCGRFLSGELGSDGGRADAV